MQEHKPIKMNAILNNVLWILFLFSIVVVLSLASPFSVRSEATNFTLSVQQQESNAKRIKIETADVNVGDYYLYDTTHINPEDVELIARVLWTEARGECLLGQTLVAQTILDRLENGFWGDSVYSVINWPNQFVVFRGNPHAQRCILVFPNLWDDLLEIAESALNGERYNQDYKILFFRSGVSHDRDWFAPFLGRVGIHAYYGYRR